jgi:pimeloyl-ACP methyl ester carboxylesterase
MSEPSSGYFSGGLPYNRFGNGPRPLVIFQGLVSAHKPQSRLASWTYNGLGKDYTVYNVVRKPGLPKGSTLRDMADDYAEMIGHEFGEPVDVIGVSTGGSVAQHFAADHPELLRRLVIHSSAHTICERGREVQMVAARLAEEGKWRQAWSEIARFMFP